MIEAADGTEAVPVFPVPTDQEAEVPPHRVMGMPELLEHLPEGREIVFLSPSAPDVPTCQVEFIACRRRRHGPAPTSSLPQRRNTRATRRTGRDVRGRG